VRPLTLLCSAVSLTRGLVSSTSPCCCKRRYQRDNRNLTKYVLNSETHVVREAEVRSQPEPRSRLACHARRQPFKLLSHTITHANAMIRYLNMVFFRQRQQSFHLGRSWRNGYSVTCRALTFTRRASSRADHTSWCVSIANNNMFKLLCIVRVCRVGASNCVKKKCAAH
jgi:hypothetical protein